MYAAFVTMKNQKVYGDGVEICSVHPDGYGMPFDVKCPRLRITHNTIASLIDPHYETVEVNLSDVWLIGRSYWNTTDEDRYIYEDPVGVNHPNARKALEAKQ
jgi:hypothetical protein